MSEQMEVVGTESTTSMAATENAEDGAAAQPTAETTVETNGTAVGEGITPPSAGEDGTTQQMAGNDNSAITIPVQFNHESRELSLAEAQTYAQKGMKLDAMSPMLDKLRLVAAANGRTLEETVEDLYGAFERSHREEILQRVGGNEEAAEALMEKKRSEWSAGSEAAKNAAQKAEENSRQALTDRLAGEFAEIKADFPEITQFSEIPKQVVNDAITNGRNLYDAYLRYQRKEGKKVENNQQAQQRAAAASTGSKSDLPSEADPFAEAAIVGLRRGLQ